MSSKFAQKILHELDRLSVLFGWGNSEYDTVKSISARIGGSIHGSDWAKNLAFHAGFEKSHFSQKATVSNEINSERIHTVCFLFTDGDNLQWLLNSFNSTTWFGHPSRSEIPVGWTFSPAMSILAPGITNEYYRMASAKDEFVAGPSGIGYAFPDLMPTDILQDFADRTAKSMKKSDMKILNIIADKFKLEAAGQFLKQSDIDAVFYYQYDRYQHLQGKIYKAANKPVIGGRFQLWDGVFDNKETILKEIVSMERNVRSVNGYSLIPVHVWSNGFADVLYLVNALKSATNIEIVLPSEFVRRIQTYVIPHLDEI